MLAKRSSLGGIRILDKLCSRGEMDITADFGSAVLGSSPGGSTLESTLVYNIINV